MEANGTTKHETAKSFMVPAHKTVKLTAFVEDNKIFKNLGTAVFTAKVGRVTKVPLRWPMLSTNAPKTYNDKMHVLQIKGDAIDHAPEWGKLLRKLNQPLGSLGGMNKFWKIDWQWPFRTPGWVGLREIKEPQPGYKAALPWLEFHALSCLGLKSFAACDDHEKLSVVSMALGATGYLDGYDHEEVDDTASLWCSFGTGNDCDDFAMATCAVTRAIVLDDSPATSALEAWVKTNVKDVYVVSGWAWPRNERKNGKKVTFGHMWCEALLKNQQTMVIECTSAVAYYGGTPIASNARKGNLSEYQTREYHWYHDKAYKIKNGKRVLLPQPAMPSWFTELRYTMPDEALDPRYSAPNPPPAPIKAFGFGNERQIKDSSGELTVRLWPFRRKGGKVVWFGKAVNQARKFGAYG